jgi:signal transduction histidine kinase
MGNVAHDLKTPLHSLEADLEILILLISKIPKATIDKAVESLQSSFFKQNFDPQSIFNAMEATLKFMVMSINRSQDFMKASNNIVLLPALETFDLGAAIAVAVTCIKNIQSHRLIMVHPFDQRICTHLVSDKHWLTENMLCLLSNAIKYGDKGHVDVHIEVIDVPNSVNVLSLKGGEIRAVKDINSTTNDDIETDSCVSPQKKESKKRMILVTVQDSGIGICEDARKHLFQPFKQAQRMAGGTGLGLYSLLKRVEALGGKVLIILFCM